MRRHWVSGLLFALALAFQAMAPVAANIAMERGSGSGPSFEICLKAAGKAAAGENQLPGPHDSKRDLCALCEVFCNGVAPLAARPNSVGSAPVQWTALAWTVADCVAPTSRPDFAHRARAPPAFS